MTPGGDELSIPANLKSLSEIRQFVRDAAGKAGCPDQAIGELTLAVDEACSNILTHGYENGEGRIGVAIRIDTGEIEVRIEDEAPLYDPFVEAPVPDVSKPILERPLGGLGVEMIRQSMDEARHEPGKKGGNLLILKKFCGGN